MRPRHLLSLSLSLSLSFFLYPTYVAIKTRAVPLVNCQWSVQWTQSTHTDTIHAPHIVVIYDSIGLPIASPPSPFQVVVCSTVLFVYLLPNIISYFNSLPSHPIGHSGSFRLASNALGTQLAYEFSVYLFFEVVI